MKNLVDTKTFSARTAALGLVLALFMAICAPAMAKTDDTAAALAAEGKFLSAVKALKANDAVLSTPDGFAQYVELIVTNYLSTDDFQSFYLADLEAGVTVRMARYLPKGQELVADGMESTIYERLSSAPDDPYLNYAAGTYLSRMIECACGEPKIFIGEAGDDVAYLEKALAKGVYSFWSLFRLGLAHQTKGEMNEAVMFYNRSLAENPDYLPAAYNLGVALFTIGDTDLARTTVERIAGKYLEPERNADVEHLLARIEISGGHNGAAEYHFLKAFEYYPWHLTATPDFMAFIGQTKGYEDYLKLVQSVIAVDYSHTRGFNLYVDYVIRTGGNPEDEKVYQELAKKLFDDPKTTAVYQYNLGRLALTLKKRSEAVKHLETSKTAFKKLDAPPADALAAIESLLEEAKK